MLIETQVDIYAGLRISLNCPTEPPIKMSLHGFIRFYLVAGQRILRRSSRIIVAIPSLSRFAASRFIDSHPILTPRKIMSNRRIMIAGYHELRVTPMASSDVIASNIWNLHALLRRIF